MICFKFTIKNSIFAYFIYDYCEENTMTEIEFEEQTAKKLNMWYDDLLWCPSQCYYYFMHDEKMFCLYLRWRHCNPWTAEVIQCAEPDYNIDNNSIRKPIEIPFFTDNELEKLKSYLTDRIDGIMELWGQGKECIDCTLL